MEYIGQAQQSEACNASVEAIAICEPPLLAFRRRKQMKKKALGMGTTIVAATLCGEKAVYGECR